MQISLTILFNYLNAIEMIHFKIYVLNSVTKNIYKIREHFPEHELV